MRNVIVVGGGAAGMMAAIIAAREGKNVTLLEQNEKLGKKLYITGKGRCNVTNAGDMEELFFNVVTNSSFLYSSFYGFTNTDMMTFLEELGCPLKIERGNRVFPVSDKSSDVIRSLEWELKRCGVSVRLRTKVKQILVENEKLVGVLLENREKITADSCIVATGGLSYPSTGSTGDGYQFAKECGHQVTDLSPALVPYVVKEAQLCKRMQGLSLKNITFTCYLNNKVKYQEFGEMMFTHFGITGPVVLSSSAHLKKEMFSQTRFEIDLKPALSREQLDARLLKDFQEMKNKRFKNALDKLLPKKMIPVVLELSGVDCEKQINSVTKEERLRLIGLLKAFPLNPVDVRGFSEAIITRGGVRVKEINPSTMESKLVSGLFFVGEVLDLDALTGGYNLQIAWSTAYAAGCSC
ncbi:MAG: NAD(P)/FAD-dependent oxidoreductase [Lachnospiraceae bacterium]